MQFVGVFCIIQAFLASNKDEFGDECGNECRNECEGECGGECKDV